VRYGYSRKPLRKYHIKKKKNVARSDQTYTDVAKQTVLAQQDVDASLIVASPIVSWKYWYCLSGT